MNDSDFPRLTAEQYMRLSSVQQTAYEDQLQAHVSRIIYDGDLEQAAALKKAGWVAESPYPHAPLMSWFWRSPGPRGGTLYRSTNQAFLALKKGHQ